MVLNLDWYTDTADVYRVVPVKTGNLTTHSRERVLSAVPCRIYRGASRPVEMRPEAAHVKQSSKLAADNAADIREGDELIITRGGRLGQTRDKIRAFAGKPEYYYEPFGAVVPGLAHQEIVLLEEERVQ